jgi:hypothetical protein
VGFLGPDDPPPPSQLASALTSAALSLPSTFSAEEKLVAFYADLQAQILSSDVASARLINHLLPLLHGFVTSLEATAHRFCFGASRHFLLPARSDMSRLADKLSGPIDQTSADGKRTLNVLARYAAMGRPLGPGMWAWETLRARTCVSANCLNERGWEGLIVDEMQNVPAHEEISDLEDCLKAYGEIFEVVLAEREKEPPDDAESEFAIDSLAESIVRLLFDICVFVFALLTVECREYRPWLL